MGFFSRSTTSRSQPLLTATPDDLRRIGVTAYGGQSTHPQGLSGIPVGELDRYAMGFLEAAGYPSAGTPPWDGAHSRFLDELSDAAERAGDWGFVGALLVGWNCVTSEHLENSRYLAILERGLDVLRRDGVAWTSVPPFAIDRWTALHGRDGIHPKGWPSALKDLQVPTTDAAPPVENLADGESRKLAQAPAAPENMIYAERRPDGSIQAIVEGRSTETGEVRRWDWDGLSASDYPSFLRELGQRLVNHTCWAHEDLIPYFPCRQRSRDQMRIDARGMEL